MLKTLCWKKRKKKKKKRKKRKKSQLAITSMQQSHIISTPCPRQHHAGAIDHNRSIVVIASFHSRSKQPASRSASSGVGTRPPHIHGISASAFAKYATSLLNPLLAHIPLLFDTSGDFQPSRQKTKPKKTLTRRQFCSALATPGSNSGSTPGPA